MNISNVNIQATSLSYQATTTYESNNDTKAQEKKMADAVIQQTVSMNALHVEMTFQSTSLSQDTALAQSVLTNLVGNNQEMNDFFSGISTKGSFSLENLGYNGKPLLELTQDEASALVGDDGFFGVDQSAQRASDFVLGFAGDDIDLLQEGRKGIVQGFGEAEKMWGGKLPDIAYETQERTLQAIDEKIASLGGNILNLVV